VKIIQLPLSLQTICDPSKANILSTSRAKFRIQLMFIFIDIQLISVKCLWDHCASLIGQVRHNNLQSKLMYFIGNNNTWIKKCVFGIQTLHHTFYYQCLTVIIFSLFDTRFNPLKHLEDLNRKIVVYIFRTNKSITIRILKVVLQHGSSLSTSKKTHGVHFSFISVVIELNHVTRPWDYYICHVVKWDTKISYSNNMYFGGNNTTWFFLNMTSINSYLDYNIIFNFLHTKLIPLKYLEEPNKNNYA
jgi:hypothetical protein